MRRERNYAPLTLLISALHSAACCATGDLAVYDDADENGFNHAAAACGSNYNYGETTVVHGGSAAIGINKIDSAGVGWAAPMTYSATSDYDGVDLWINAGSSATSITSLAVDDAEFVRHFLHLEDVYGAALPANTWIHFQIPFASPFFVANSSTPPATVVAICVISHNTDGFGTFFYIDDVSLTAADIFKDGFEG